MPRICFIFVLTWFNAAFAPTRSAAQELEIPRTDGVITPDGVPDEPAWSKARVLPMEMFEPTFGAPITRTSTVRIAHDGGFLYAAGMFMDDAPVRANSLIRDYYGGGTAAGYEMGADAKVAVGDHSTIDLTINTDFAQTESDDERLNLNRFDLFYPEKRQFFLERSGIFDVGEGEDHRVFYSRRIGLSPAGEPQRIYGGARLTGRVGEWEYGALSMQTDQPGGGSLNNTAVRFRRRIGNRLSQLGGISTAVLGGGEGVAAAGALDTEIHVGGSHFLSVMTALSTDSPEDAAASLRLVAEKRNNEGFAYRYNFREGHDLYAVWNEGWAAEAGDWKAARRTLLVKYSRATWW